MTESRFAAVAAEWVAIGRQGIPDEEQFRVVQAEATAIRNAGLWVSGPADMLSILGRHRDELIHSRSLAWLMNPSGRHGLGDRFLRNFLAQVVPEVSPTLRDVRIRLEETRTGINGVTGATMEARADLVITTESLLVVVENKVGAGEQPDQCERLYWPWAGEAIETHWVFLSPSGRQPGSAYTAEAIDAWRAISYPEVRLALQEALDDTADRPASIGRGTAQQYLATLVSHHA